MTDFTGKSVLITGGSGGIGSETARQFLTRGAEVALVDLSAEALESTKRELVEYGRVITIQADVTVEADVERYVSETVAAFGKIDVFFNNAGIEGPVGSLVDLDLSDFAKVFAVNVQGVFLGLKHVLRVQLEQGFGNIINTSSEAGLDGSPQVSAYVASKHAVSGLTKSAALEVAAQGIRINSIHPSGVNTNMVRRLEEGFGQGDTASARQAFEAGIPAGRYAEPEDIALAVTLIASDDARWITGAQIRVDGGRGAQ